MLDLIVSGTVEERVFQIKDNKANEIGAAASSDKSRTSMATMKALVGTASRQTLLHRLQHLLLHRSYLPLAAARHLTLLNCGQQTALCRLLSSH